MKQDGLPMQSLKVAVVIPFFQKQAGLLTAAVRSVLAQQGGHRLRVIVVDDGAPIEARAELAELIQQHPAELLVVRQPNGGPGAARNHGLDLVEADTDLVGFLDSDDVWESGYLDAAATALAAGCDMFFANSLRFGKEGTRFEWPTSSGRQLLASEHLCLHVFQGDFFDFALRSSGVISTSTLAYRLAAAPQLRFNAQLFNGQDRYFKLELAQRARCVGFSTQVGAVEGVGVNIFDSAGWGTARSLNLVCNYIRLSRLILRSLPLNPAQQAYMKAQLNKSRYSMVGTLLHLLRAGVHIDMAALRRVARDDPGTLWCMLPNLARILFSKLGRSATAGPQH
jgi:succinoglycan biosynthesis protein ExoW